MAEREEEGADEKREKDEPNDESQNDFAAHERPSFSSAAALCLFECCNNVFERCQSQFNIV